MDIAEKLRLLRLRNNLTVQEAAERCGYSAPLIKKIETGYSPKLDCLNAMLNAYSSNLAEFFQGPRQVMSAEDNELFSELEFILKEGQKGSEDKQKRAMAIRENIHEFYQNAIRPVPGTRKKRAEEIQEQPHGKFKIANS